MAINFMQSLFDPMRSPSMPFNPAGAPSMPVMQGNMQNMASGSGNLPTNILEATQNANQPAVQQVPQRQRRSFLDTIGQISDVLARVGGAEALYQPTLDAREDRARQIDLEEMQKQLREQQLQIGNQTITANEGEIADTARARLGQALGSLAGNPDAAALWPQIAAQVGIDEQQVAQVGGLIAGGIAPEQIAAGLGWSPQASGQGREYGLQPFYAQGPDGTLRAYQLGKDGSIQPVQLGEGETPIDPLRFVDTGGAQVGVGTRSGSVQRILPNSVDPNTRATISSRERIVADSNASRERAAAEKSSATAAKGSGAGQRILDRLGTISGAVDQLESMGALVTPGDTSRNIVRSARASGIGQMVEGFIGTDVSEQRQLIQQEADAIVAEMKEALNLTGTMMDRPQEYQRYVNIINNPSTTATNMRKAIQGLQRQFQSDMARGNNQTTKSNSSSTGNVVTVTSIDQARNLPSGTRFRTPDGQVRVKK